MTRVCAHITHQSASMMTRNAIDAAHSASGASFRDAFVDAEPDQPRSGDGRERVERDENEPGEERANGTGAGTG